MKEWFEEFSKTPVGVAICIGLFVLVYLIYIFAHTSIGKKALKELRKRADAVDKANTEHETKVKNDFEKERKSREKEIAELKELVEKYKTELCTALKLINNKKLKTFIKGIENNSYDKVSTDNGKDALRG